MPRLQASFARKPRLPTPPPTATAKPPRSSGGRGTALPEHAGRGDPASLAPRPGGRALPQRAKTKRRPFGSNGGSCFPPRASPPARPGRGARAPATCAAGGGRAAPAPAGEREGAAGGAETSPFPGTATLSAPPQSPPLPAGSGSAPPSRPRQAQAGWKPRAGAAGALLAPCGRRGRTTPPARPRPLRRGPPPPPRLPPLTRGRSCSWGSAASRCSRGSGAACARRCGR